MAIGSAGQGSTQAGGKAHLETCIKLLLLWVAVADGSLDEAELEFAASRFPDVEGEADVRDLLTIIRNFDLASLEAAVRVVAGQTRELRTAFLDTAIAMSMADREIAPSENHLLRFYCDALFLGDALLEKRFQAITGSPLPEPGDLGDLAWWERRERQGHTQAVGKPTEPPINRGPERTAAASLSPAEARNVLGLEDDASPQQIEEAYRNLAAMFEPDRVAMMGEAASRVAARTLRKVRQAYELLREGQS